MQVNSRGALLGTAALALASAPLAAQEPATPDQPEACRLVLEQTPIQVQADAFNVDVLLERELGYELTASVAEESGLQVAIVPPEVEPAAERIGEVAEREADAAKEAQEQPADAAAEAAEEFAAKQIITLKLDASAAQPGEYDIQVSGDAGQCSGKVTVAAQEPGGQ